MSDASALKYRRDIDGLRAVAVLAVLVFHIFPEWLPGGFVGVDIFFVISGFLISGIILSELEAQRFSFADFYARRIRRIFPALALICGITLLFGWLTLLPTEFRQLGKHALGGATFSSNIVLLKEAGYFDSEAWRKPLLHLWSLGVEEQYYTVWPLLLYFVKRRHGATIALIAAIGLVSFGLNLYVTYRSPSAAFYLPFTRFWELMAGSALAYAGQYASGANQVRADASRRLKQLCSVTGCVLIVVSIVVLDEKHPFPGWWAVLVCAGAVLMIGAGPQTWCNRVLLSNPLMVYIGLISYPLYMWHMPLLSYMKLIDMEASTGMRLAIFPAATLLAWLTYRFIELPIRHAKAPTVRRRITLRLASAVAVVGIVGALAWRNVIPPVSAADPRLVEVSTAATDFENPNDITVPGASGSTVLFFGDSHMEQYWPRIHALARQEAAPMKTVVFRALGGCAPMPAVEREGLHCEDFVVEALRRASEPDVDTVVLAASWVGFAYRGDYYRIGDSSHRYLDFFSADTDWVFDEFAASLRKLREQGKRVVVLLSSPRGADFDPLAMVDRSRVVPRFRPTPPVSRAVLDELILPIDRRIEAAVVKAGAELLRPADWFCSATECPTVDAATGGPLFKDISHLRASVVRTQVTELDRFVVTKSMASTR